MPLRHTSKVSGLVRSSLDRDGTLFEKAQNEQLGGSQRANGQKGEKFCGMLNDTVWKYNPNSYYNEMNDNKNIEPKSGEKRQFKETYQDQRAYFLHRRHLAAAIEKARNGDAEALVAADEAKKKQVELE